VWAVDEVRNRPPLAVRSSVIREEADPRGFFVLEGLWIMLPYWLMPN